jgi:hypothetical protein
MGMAVGDDGYTSSAWPGDNVDQSDGINSISHASHGHSQPRPVESPRTSPTPNFYPTSGSPPRSSSDSFAGPATSKWRESLPAPTLERKDTLATIPSDVPNDTSSLVEPSFDENVLRALCDLDVSVFWSVRTCNLTRRRSSVEFLCC